MHQHNASTRILRIAAWIWISFLLAMAMMDFALYSQLSLSNTQNPSLLQNTQSQQSASLDQQSDQQTQPANPYKPVYFFYAASGLVASTFFIFAHSGWIQRKLGNIFCPLLLLIISTAPIIINVLITPRFPSGPLANAEGMALRQVPVLLIALALVAWEYKLIHVILFSLATTALEFLLIYYFNPIISQKISVFVFISIIRTISFIAVGVFISLIVTQLREQRESLREANAKLTHYASTLEQLTVSRERNRLARELHDTLAHSLTAISLSLETAKAYFDIDPDQTRNLIEKSLESTHVGVDETRRALKALRSNALEDMGLRLAIQRVAESAATRLRLNLTLDLKNPMPSLSPDVEQAIYRIAQEAIENIVNHSHAKNFTVYLESDSQTTLIIQDDGVGFDLNAKVTGHFGVIGMHERAELAGGKLLIESENGKGTKVILTM
jgi:signal transduction histidine kinase